MGAGCAASVVGTSAGGRAPGQPPSSLLRLVSTEQVRTWSDEIAGIALARRRKGARRARAAAVATDDHEALGTAQLGAAFAFAILVRSSSTSRSS